MLDYLCTWNKDIKLEHLDSSDMIAYGYFWDEDKIINDVKFNYDSFEYYDFKLHNKNVFLLTISNFIKGKIELDLLLASYDFVKRKSYITSLDRFTNEGLKLAGIKNI